MITGSKYCKTPGCHTQNEEFDSHLGAGTCPGLCQVCSLGIPAGRVLRGDPRFGAVLDPDAPTPIHPSRWDLLIKNLVKTPGHRGLAGS